MDLVLLVLCFCMLTTGANAYEQLKSGAVESKVVNPGTKSKFDQLGIDVEDRVAVGNKDRNAAGNMKRWIGGIVPYIFDSSLKSLLVPFINDAMADYHRYTCIKFVPRTTEDDFIKFVDGTTCSSNIGRIGTFGGQKVTLASGCNSKATVIHELMHAIGFDHEQCRPDRDDFINVFMDKVPEEKRHNFDKFDAGNTFNFAYDFGSIMHYSNTSFGIDKAITMSRKDGKPLVVQKLGFGDYDIQKINIYYGCDKGGPAAPASEFTTLPPTPPSTWTCSSVVRDSCDGIKAKCGSLGWRYNWTFKSSICTQNCFCKTPSV